MGILKGICKNLMGSGGDLWEVGGTLDILAGGVLKLASVDITAFLSTLVNSIPGVTFDRSVKVAKVALAALDTGGGVLSWANPEAGTIIISRVIVRATTKTNAACSVDVGTTAVSGTTASDNIIDGLDLGTAAGTFDTSSQAGANGKTCQELAAGKWLTISKDSGAAAGLVGFAYIHYIPV